MRTNGAAHLCQCAAARKKHRISDAKHDLGFIFHVNELWSTSDHLLRTRPQETRYEPQSQPLRQGYQTRDKGPEMEFG